MKTLTFYFLALIAVGCAGQQRGIKQVDELEHRTLSNKKLIIRFEKVDTVVENERHIKVSRSYYFDKERKNLLLITIYENQLRPRRGFQLLYIFSDSKLAKVKTIPSKMVCRRCNGEYYFSNDSLIYKSEVNYSAKNIFSFVDDSKTLSSKVLYRMQ